MDGPHDLGGKQGFGPVDVDEPDVPFHHEWEGRMWGISRCSGAPDLTIDWWRHVRELIEPVDYLTRPYFDSWAQTELATYLNADVMTLDEIKTGHSATAPLAEAPVQDLAEAIATERKSSSNYSREIEAAPLFTPGSSIRTRPFTSARHTRLPAYARAKPGIIHVHHGAHLLPDEGAKGNELAQHLYSVKFVAGDLWPEAAGRRDHIFLDLWESYLEPI